MAGHLEVDAAHRDELLVRPLLDDPAGVHHEDPVAVEHGAEAVAHEHDRPLALQRVERLGVPFVNATGWAAWFFSMTVTAILSWIVLPHVAYVQRPWLTGFFLFLIVFSALAGVGSLYVRQRAKDWLRDEVTDICGDMDDIRETYYYSEGS